MRNSRLRLCAVLCATAIGFALGAASSAYAGTACGSWWSYTVANIGYHNRARVQTDATGARAWTDVETYNPTRNVAAGYMGVLTRLYDSSGVCHKTDGWWYNGSICVGISSFGRYYSMSGAYYSRGVSRGWNGSSYTEYNTLPSPYQNWP